MIIKSFALSIVLFTVATKGNPEHQAVDLISIPWSQQDLFFYGMMAGAFVSMIGFIAAFLLLFLKKLTSETFYTIIIQLLFAFSCGALLGQAMHILPEAYSSKHLREDHKVSLTFIVSIFFFIFLERLMNFFGVAHTHWHQNQGHQHPQNPPAIQNQQREPTGFLNLFSSLLHNFIDGLAIGIAFSLGDQSQFQAVTLGIIYHEIPRQMGDVAILLKSNFNQKETILSNGFVNLISLVGVYMGLNSHELSPTTKQYALVFVAGNFLYIASDIWKNLFHHRQLYLNCFEFIGLFYGVYLTLFSCDHNH